MTQPSGPSAALAELAAHRSVRAALVVRDGRPVSIAADGGLSGQALLDLAKTVRRMQLASATVGAAFDEVCISLAGVRLLVRALDANGAVVLLLRRGADVAAVRADLGRRFAYLVREERHRRPDPEVTAAVDSPEDEARRLWDGPLGPLLVRVRNAFSARVAGADDPVDIDAVFDEQLREWLLCCSPSARTFPLLLDGLSGAVAGAGGSPRAFKEAVQKILDEMGPWPGEDGEVDRAG